MIRLIKKLLHGFNKDKKYVCARCKYKLNAKYRKAWFCKLKYSTVKTRRAYYDCICGNKKPKTSPVWCPLKKR